MKNKLLGCDISKVKLDYGEIKIEGYGTTDVEKLFKLYCYTNDIFCFKLPDEANSVEYIFAINQFDPLPEDCLYEPGVPDFFIIKNKEWLFVETKSETDSLRLSQLNWFSKYLNLDRVVITILVGKTEKIELIQDHIDQAIITNVIEQIIQDKNIDTTMGVPIEEIKRSENGEGFSGEKVDTLIEQMTRDGSVYTPTPNHYRNVK